MGPIDHPEAARVADELRDLERQLDEIGDGQSGVARDAAALIDTQSARIAELEKALRDLLSSPANDDFDATPTWTEDRKFFLTQRQHAERAARAALTPIPEDPKP